MKIKIRRSNRTMKYTDTIDYRPLELIINNKVRTQSRLGYTYELIVKGIGLLGIAFGIWTLMSLTIILFG